MCVLNSHLFQHCQDIWLFPFFQQKVYEWPDFSEFLCERPHFSDILVYAHIFRSEIFRGCLSSWYYMHWLWYLCNNQQKNGFKKSKGSIWIGQHFGWSSVWMGPFFQRPGTCTVYEWGGFWNTGSHTCTKITPKLHPTPPPEFATMPMVLWNLGWGGGGWGIAGLVCHCSGIPQLLHGDHLTDS